MKRRNFLQVLLGVPAAVAMGADAISALRPVKEPEPFIGMDLGFDDSTAAIKVSEDGIEVISNEQFYGKSIPELLHVQKAQANMNRMYRGFIDGQG